MKKGSITPFCAMSLMIIASLLFALLESARIYGLDCYAGMKVETGIDSVCGEYQPFLWKQYGLLFLDGAYGAEYFSMNYVTERLEHYLKENCDTSGWVQEKFGLDLFRLAPEEVQLKGYSLATDAEGDIFLKYVAEREKERLPIGVAEDLYEQYKKGQDLEKQYGGVEESIRKAQQVLSEVELEWLQKQEELGEADAAEYAKPDTSVLESALKSARQVQSSGTLNMVFSDLTEISLTSIPQSANLQARKKLEGNLCLSESVSWYEKLLVLNYVEETFSSYTNVKKDHFLNYEVEYVICGKSTDWENLDGALNRILAIREAANVAYLLQDKEKMALAEGLAGLVGLMAGENPGVVKVIQAGIIGAWAYMESVLDVRELVAGGCIPLIKQEEEWTTEITNLFVVFNKDARAKACAYGLSYEEYLKQILFVQANSRLAYRMMEVMEIGMRQVADYENCRMNQMIVAVRYGVKFQGRPLFSSLVSIGKVYDGNYYFSKDVERSYVP